LGYPAVIGYNASRLPYSLPTTWVNEMKFQFTIRDLLWLTALVAMSIGWWLDHSKAPRYTVRTVSPAGYQVLEDCETGKTLIIGGEMP
jgi:hypothetical protein